MDNILREKLTQLTSKCQILQKNGKYVECIDIMEEIVGIKKNVYGIDHPQFDKASEKLSQYLNLAAMVFLHKEKFDQTLDYLRKAELVSRSSIPLKATTYNNLACYYRRVGKARTALSYLIKALQLELKIDHPKTLADTHLNLCAVLSQLDRHQDALQHSMLSIILIQDQFLSNLLPKFKESEQDLNDERLAVLAIAYHNLGVQFQHLKRFDEALKIYKKALQLSKDYMSTNQQLVKNLTKVVNSASEQIQEQRKSFLEGKKTKLERDLSETKKDIYKDLSKTVQRYRHLPKIKFNSRQYSSNSNYEQNYNDENPYSPHEQRSIQQLNYPPNNKKQKSINTRYNKPFLMTPDNRSQMDSQLKVRESEKEQKKQQHVGQ